MKEFDNNNFDSQLVLGNTGIFPERREAELPLNEPFRDTLRRLRPFKRMEIDGKIYNALPDIRTVGKFLVELIPSKADILEWATRNNALVKAHQREYLEALTAPNLREKNIPKLSQAIIELQQQDGIIEEVAREKATHILMTRHGFDPNQECDRKTFTGYLTRAARIADELVMEERSDLNVFWKRTSLPVMTDLQEEVKSEDFYTTIRLATNPDATSKIREEATRKAVLMDKAIAAMLRIEHANGTMDEVHNVLNEHLWKAKKIGEINPKGIIATHDKMTEGVLSWKVYDRDSDGEPGSLLPESDEWIQRYYDMPYHLIKADDGSLIPVFMTSRTKKDVAALAKLLLKNGELPEDVRGIRFVVDNPDQAISLTQEIQKAFDKSGWRLNILPTGQTITLTGEFSILLPDGSPFQFKFAETVENKAKSDGFGVLQYDVDPTPITDSARHEIHAMRQFEIQTSSVPALLNSQRKRELHTRKVTMHPGYATVKRGQEKRSIIIGGKKVADNFFSYIFPDQHLVTIQERPDDRPGDAEKRVRTLIDSDENPVVMTLIEEAHRKIREQTDNRYIPY
jgi:hypothetical protein